MKIKQVVIVFSLLLLALSTGCAKSKEEFRLEEGVTKKEAIEVSESIEEEATSTPIQTPTSTPEPEPEVENADLPDAEELETAQVKETMKEEVYDVETLINQIREGDFSNLKDVKESEGIPSERFEDSFTVHQKYEGIEWVELDIDGDNINELIWQEKESYNNYMKSIIGIFSFQSDGVTCILWDVNDGTEFCFLGANGNIIYYTQYYGTYEYNGYEHYQCDIEGNMNYVGGLYLYDIYDYAEVDADWWHKEHPDMLSEGTYYKKVTIKSGKDERVEDNLDKETFIKEFNEMTGNSFDDLKPEWMKD